MVMATLAEKLTAPDVRPKVIRACEDLVAAEVASKGGFTGAAIKTAFSVVKKIKPGIIGEVIDKLLPEFAQALDPMHQEALTKAGEQGRPASEAFVEHLESNQDKAANALLSVTDARARSAKNSTIGKTYDKLRGNAQEHVRTAVPNLARTLAPFV